MPHRQWVFSIPKRLRIYFMFDRRLLAKLSRCAWKVLNLYLTQTGAYDDAKAGAAVAVQSFGDFQNFHPHLHVLATDGCFYNDAAFMVCLPPETFIIYDELSSPGADDPPSLMMLRRDTLHN